MPRKLSIASLKRHDVAFPVNKLLARHSGGSRY